MAHHVEGRAAVKLLLSGALAAGILAAALPRVAGAGWSDIGTALGRLSLAQLLLLAAVWLAGLWVHTPALTAALPGLSHRRALLLNLTGSFVSNLLPLGGAAGTVANWRMARSWGFASPAFARWAILTNLFDTALKLVLRKGLPVTPDTAPSLLVQLRSVQARSISSAAHRPNAASSCMRNSGAR